MAASTACQAHESAARPQAAELGATVRTPAAEAPGTDETKAATRRPAPVDFVALSDNAYGGYKYAPEAPELGDLAPQTTGVLSTGADFDLAEALESQRVLLVFYRGDW